MKWEIIFRLVALYAGGFLTLVFGAITWRLLRISPEKYRKLQRASPYFWEILFGVGGKIKNSTARNHYQRVFPAVNAKNNQWEARAFLKDNSLRDLLE